MNNADLPGINIILNGTPYGHTAGRFVDVVNDAGEGISIGEWIKREDGYWSLRITELPEPQEIPQFEGTRAALNNLSIRSKQ
jgi:hypothetical protein